ncbi:hypothetical protein C9374_011787 [Naegleria lovaniensis]|uniref:Uncharacterized protein n=1 Tax=Naegleria lovaniensis TaxID=51637 RepID=A0AA88KCY4_NAELO|nr:uncharacterized protein C9374_011787 [Naegleria lovaniensis]KAG2373698.1 hypothetical protein C9374_011787 [Naegleria lovaniensis]
MYFKKCADNLGICISLLPRPAIISHQLFVTTFPVNVDLDWNQALFVFRNKIISTCEPTLLAPTLNSMDKYETCSVYSFLFKPVKKLAFDTYLRTKKPKLFINEYQAFLKHELVLNCLDRFQVLLKIAQENTYEVQFILSKQFSTTPLYILEELDALTISKHKELCKQLSLIPPKSSNNAIKKKQLKTLEEQQQENDLSFKNFKLFNWRNDLLLKTLNISEEEFHNMKRKEQHRESRATKDSSSSQKKNHSCSNHPMAILGDFNTCKDYYYNDYYYSHPYYEEDDE